MAEAEAQLYRRIQELRTRARADRAPGGAADTPTALPTCARSSPAPRLTSANCAPTASVARAVAARGGRTRRGAGDGRALDAAPPGRAERPGALAGGPGGAGQPRPPQRTAGPRRGPRAPGRSVLDRHVDAAPGRRRRHQRAFAHGLVGERRGRPARPAAAGHRRAAAPVRCARPLPARPSRRSCRTLPTRAADSRIYTPGCP